MALESVLGVSSVWISDSVDILIEFNPRLTAVSKKNNKHLCGFSRSSVFFFFSLKLKRRHFAVQVKVSLTVSPSSSLLLSQLTEV